MQTYLRSKTNTGKSPATADQKPERIMTLRSGRAITKKPKATGSKAKKNKDQNSNLPQCTICFAEIASGLITLDCSHVFHQECFEQWRITNTHQSKCPVCR